jgi:hypothetical protein
MGTIMCSAKQDNVKKTQSSTHQKRGGFEPDNKQCKKRQNDFMVKQNSAV